MSADGEARGEKFLNRWSRLKAEAREAPAAPVPKPQLDPRDEPPPLPPIEKLTIDSDFRGFFHPKVDEDVRRAALRKLFTDPHFNVMDGLDVYIDDYSKSEPIPAAMLAGLKQAQRILEWAKESEESAKLEQQGASQSGTQASATTLPDAAPSSVPCEDGEAAETPASNPGAS